MTMNQDGNVVGRLGAVAVIVAALYGVHKVQCSTGYCPTMQQASASCCPTGAEHGEKTGEAKAPEAKAAEKAPAKAEAKSAAAAPAPAAH